MYRSQRILSALFTKGRSTITQLAQYTSVTPRYLRNGLSVLIQQNLVYHSTDSDSKATSYEANANASYNIVRFGKILEVIESQYGTTERDLVQTLMLLGFARVADLAQAFQSRTPKANGHVNSTSDDANGGLIESVNQLNDTLARLIQAEIVETVHAESFRNPVEVHRTIVTELTKAAPGEKVSKITSEQEAQISERFKTFRDKGKSLKRQLDQTRGPMTKRRKLQSGHANHFDVATASINPNIIVRVNYEKCIVELRNQRMANFVTEVLGEVTGDVYRVVLDMLTATVPRCRSDARVDEDLSMGQLAVTTVDILRSLDDSLSLQQGIGKAPTEKIDAESAERIRPQAPMDSDTEPDESDTEMPVRRASIRIDIDQELGDSEDDIAETNGDRETKVKFEDGGISRDRRIEHLRQHLLLLSESKYRFIRQCGSQGRGQWTVDFARVMNRLRESELDSYIEQSFGRHGLRLTKILREKGKLDEKMLPAAALMKKSDVQLKMTAMQMAGLVDVQEVPKDNSRLANRTLFFWFFDRERTEARIMDDIYKGMMRCQQTLQVERHRERNILSFVERKDVKGKEEEVMTAEHYNKYNRHLEAQDKLIGQLMRLDDMAAVFQDY